MNETVEDRAEYTLKLMRQGIYNNSRPDQIIINDLVEVIIYLSNEIEKLKNDT